MTSACGISVPTPWLDGRADSQHRQARQRGAIFTDYYAEASCTAGRANFITGELPIRTGLTTVGQAGAKIGIPDQAPTIATALKEHGLRHRAVRQEPPGRPERIPAHRPRLRRILRLPLSPRCDGGPVAPELSEGPAEQGRSAQRPALLCDRQGRPDGRSPLGQGGQTEDH